MSNMTFGVNLIPSSNNTYTLGNSDKKWNLYVNSINGQTFSQPILYGECSTGADTAAKTVSISGFALAAGVTIQVKFTYANTAASPTLSVSSTTAASIALNNGNLSPWDDGEVVTLTYDGTNWNINDYGKIEVIRL